MSALCQAFVNSEDGVRVQCHRDGGHDGQHESTVLVDVIPTRVTWGYGAILRFRDVKVAPLPPPAGARARWDHRPFACGHLSDGATDAGSFDACVSPGGCMDYPTRRALAALRPTALQTRRSSEVLRDVAVLLQAEGESSYTDAYGAQMFELASVVRRIALALDKVREKAELHCHGGFHGGDCLCRVLASLGECEVRS